MELSRNSVGLYRKPSISQVILQTLLSQAENIITFSLQEIVFRATIIVKEEEEKKLWESVKETLDGTLKSLRETRLALDTYYDSKE